MFDQLKNLKDLASLMGNAGEMKERFEKVQAQLATKRVEADAGAGAVRVVANGKMEILEVHLDPAMIAAVAGQGAEADRAMIEDLIVAASNEALGRARQLVQEEMAKAAGGLNLPGLDKMLGGQS